MIRNPWAGKQRHDGKYRGAWVRFDPFLAQKISAAGYGLFYQTQGLPSVSELNRRFGPSFEEWVTTNLLPNFPGLGSFGGSNRDRLDAVMGFIALQDFGSVIQDEDKKWYLALAEVRLKMVDNSSGVRTTLDEITHSFLDPKMRNPNLGPLSPGIVFNPGGMSILEIPVTSTQSVWALMEFHYIIPK